MVHGADYSLALPLPSYSTISVSVYFRKIMHDTEEHHLPRGCALRGAQTFYLTQMVFAFKNSRKP